MTRGPAALLAACVLAVACALVVLVVPVVALKVVAAVTLGLVLPGYTLVEATFARHPIRWSVRLLLTLVVGVATLIVGGLLLHAVVGELSREGWTAWALAVVIFASVVATARRPVRRVQRRAPRKRLRAPEIVLIVGTFAALAGALAISRTTLEARNVLGYTQLWTVATGTLDAPAIVVGVRSAEQQRRKYRLVVRVGRRAPTFAAWLVLAPGQSYERRISVPMVRERSDIVTTRLYRAEEPADAYRRVTAKPIATLLADRPRDSDLLGGAVAGGGRSRKDRTSSEVRVTVPGAAGGTLKTLFIGDSLLAGARTGIVSALEERRDVVDFWRRLPATDDLPPDMDLVVLGFGTDRWHSINDVEAFAREYSGVVRRVRRSSRNATLVCLGVYRPSTTSRVTRGMEEVIRARCRGGIFIPLSDHYAPSGRTAERVTQAVASRLRF